MQHRHIPTELPPFSKGGRGGDLRPRKIPLNPPFPKGEVKASTTKRSQKYSESRRLPLHYFCGPLYNLQFLNYRPGLQFFFQIVNWQS